MNKTQKIASIWSILIEKEISAQMVDVLLAQAELIKSLDCCEKPSCCSKPKEVKSKAKVEESPKAKVEEREEGRSLPVDNITPSHFFQETAEINNPLLEF